MLSRTKQWLLVRAQSAAHRVVGALQTGQARGVGGLALAMCAAGARSPGPLLVSPGALLVSPGASLVSPGALLEFRGTSRAFQRALRAALGALLALLCTVLAPLPAHANNACPALLNHSMPRLQDEVPHNLCQYAGKVVLMVNTASKCGFTSQYEGLEKLYDRYRSAGLVVLGFPSGDFGGQELATNKEIAEFCSNTFAVRFPMLVKSSVRGKEANPVFAGLIRESGTAPKWNFYKYLIGRDGRLIKVYSSFTSPDEAGFVQDIERSLKKGS